jgi:hypothetical protein
VPRPLRLTLVAVVALLTLAGLVWLASAWYSSRLPGTYSVMDYAVADYGGGPRHFTSRLHSSHGDLTNIPFTGNMVLQIALTILLTSVFACPLVVASLTDRL